MTRRDARRRGATYTLIVLATGVLLVAAGTTLSDAARGVVRFTAGEGRRFVAREALFAGVRWAQAAVVARPGRGEGRLLLAGGPVDVHYAVRGRDGALLVTATAPAADPPTTLQAVLVPEGRGFRLASFELGAER